VTMPGLSQRQMPSKVDGPWMNSSLSPDERAALVLKAMTLDEKAAPWSVDADPVDLTADMVRAVGRLAYLQREAWPQSQKPGLIWLGGFRSDMRGGKATFLDEFAANQGRAYLRFARNAAYADPETSLADGDEVVCIPPVSGGTVGAEAATIAIMVGGEDRVFQAALSVVLLAAAILMTKSIAHLENQNFGVVTANRYVLHLDPSAAGYTSDSAPALYRQIEGRFSALPGVKSFSMATYSPLEAITGENASFNKGIPHRDTTRIASGSPEMWRDIALANRKNLGRSLDTFIADLQKFRRLVKKGDATAITKFFETAKKRRDNWCAGCASPSPE